jgi:hypothetical protein
MGTRGGGINRRCRLYVGWECPKELDTLSGPYGGSLADLRHGKHRNAHPNPVLHLSCFPIAHRGTSLVVSTQLDLRGVGIKKFLFL